MSICSHEKKKLELREAREEIEEKDREVAELRKGIDEFRSRSEEASKIAEGIRAARDWELTLRSADPDMDEIARLNSVATAAFDGVDWKGLNAAIASFDFGAFSKLEAAFAKDQRAFGKLEAAFAEEQEKLNEVAKKLNKLT